MNPLAQFSTDDLLEEIVRRTNLNETREPIKPCDECAHFRAWEKEGLSPEGWTCCAKGHAQSFRMPPAIGGDNWGFYRRVCVDRQEQK